LQLELLGGQEGRHDAVLREDSRGQQRKGHNKRKKRAKMKSLIERLAIDEGAARDKKGAAILMERIRMKLTSRLQTPTPLTKL